MLLQSIAGRAGAILCLLVSVTYQSHIHVEMETQTVCEHENQEEYLGISCFAGMALYIERVFYGRNDTQTCVVDGMDSTSPCSHNNAFELVSTQCNGRDWCNINATANFFDDNCPLVSKYLQVDYTCAECGNDWGTDSDCATWALGGDCEANTDWMYEHCRETCTGCHTAHSCLNNAGFDDCVFWSFNGECQKNPDWMSLHCREACNLCAREEPATADCADGYCLNGAQCVQDEVTNQASCVCTDNYSDERCSTTTYPESQTWKLIAGVIGGVIVVIVVIFIFLWLWWSCRATDDTVALQLQSTSIPQGPPIQTINVHHHYSPQFETFPGMARHNNLMEGQLAYAMGRMLTMPEQSLAAYGSMPKGQQYMQRNGTGMVRHNNLMEGPLAYPMGRMLTMPEPSLAAYGAYGSMPTSQHYMQRNGSALYDNHKFAKITEL